MGFKLMKNTIFLLNLINNQMKKLLLILLSALSVSVFAQSISVKINGSQGGYNFGDVEVNTTVDVTIEFINTYTKSITVYLLGESNGLYPGIDADSRNNCGVTEGAFIVLENGGQVSSVTIGANATKSLTLRFSPKSFVYQKFMGYDGAGCDPRDPGCIPFFFPICESANSTELGDYSAGLLFSYSPTGSANVQLTPQVSGKGVAATVGIEEVLDLNVQLYPNPTSSTVSISKVTKWSLRSLAGNLVKEGFGNSIDMVELESGLYIVETNDGSTIQQQKVIKN